MAACAISSKTSSSIRNGAKLHRGVDVVPISPQVFDLLDYLIRNRVLTVGVLIPLSLAVNLWRRK